MVQAGLRRAYARTGRDRDFAVLDPLESTSARLTAASLCVLMWTMVRDVHSGQRTVLPVAGRRAHRVSRLAASS